MVSKGQLELLFSPLHTSAALVLQHILWDTGQLPPSVIAYTHLHVQIEFSTHAPSRLTASNAYLSTQHIFVDTQCVCTSVVFLVFSVKAQYGMPGLLKLLQ